MKLAIFYHCLFHLGDPHELRPMAVAIVMEQMQQLKESGLLAAADEMIVGINGGQESEVPALMTLPAKAKCVYHGLKSRAENLTIVALHEWCKTHLGWAVLYFHAKGCTPIKDQDCCRKWKSSLSKRLWYGNDTNLWESIRRRMG